MGAYIARNACRIYAYTYVGYSIYVEFEDNILTGGCNGVDSRALDAKAVIL